ncbi:MAG: hypothetical protein FJ279_26415 [Planctomycetes bacterium]|nr:hypothetical protein [Planctomycetota bacterium]
MFKRIAVVLVMLATAAVAGSAAMKAHWPGVWTRLERQVTEVVGWTEDARQTDPVGFVVFAERKLGSDLAAMEAARRALAAEIGQVLEEYRQQEALGRQSRALAEEFRTAYQEAEATGGFPIEVRQAAYTAEQVRTQVSLLLAEADGYEAAAARLETVRQEAEASLQSLLVQINRSEADLAALAAQRELLRVRQLSHEGEYLLAQVNGLLDENARVLQASPVRPVRELLAAVDRERPGASDRRRVEAFLAALPASDDGDESDPGPRSEPPASEAEEPAPQASEQAAEAQDTDVEAVAASALPAVEDEAPPEAGEADDCTEVAAGPEEEPAVAGGEPSEAAPCLPPPTCDAAEPVEKPRAHRVARPVAKPESPALDDVPVSGDLALPSNPKRPFFQQY